MATVSPVVQAVTNRSSANLILWEALATGDTINAYQTVQREAVKATVQMFGTWGAATVIMQGSNDGTNWIALKDPLGNAITLSANGYFEISTAFAYLRPSISGGTGDDIDVLLSLRGLERD